LTGGIATGKSVVAKILESHGCHIHSADLMAHAVIEPRQPAWRKIVSHFGREILRPDQTINRAKLGAIVFSNSGERAFLNGVIHPLVLKKKKEAIRRLQREGRAKIFVSEAALTIESGFTGFFDRIIVANCRKAIQVQRLMSRDKISQKEALKKIQSQMPSRQKLKFADYIVDTSGTLRETQDQAEKIFRLLMRDYKEKCLKNKKFY
jgi:dephospho-CoA kinase